MMTTSVSGLRRRTSSRNSSPLIPGIKRSTSARAYELRLRASTASVGLVKASMRRSSRCSARLSERHKFTSSSSKSIEYCISFLLGCRFHAAVGLDREGDGELAALSQFRGHGDHSTMRRDNAVTDRETQSETRPAFFRGVERVENVIDVRWGDPRSVVAQLDQRPTAPAFKRFARVYPDRAVSRHGVGGIEQQVEEDLLYLVRIDP